MQAFVNSASSQEVFNGAVTIKSNHLAHLRFIDTNNPFLDSDTDDVIKNHNSGSRVITVDETRTYLAASSLMHSLDGWVYLAHSIESFLKGDKGIAVHLAYYAELRATMSFLACEGIGVLNFRHFCATSGGHCSPCSHRLGTHKFVWEALKEYLNSPSKPKEAILKEFVYSGKNFLEWLNAIPNSSALIADRVIKDWITEWSFDVNLFSTDKDLRNEVSYKPKRLKDNSNIDLTDAISKLSSFWNLLEPKETEKFSLLDKFLLKILFQKVYAYIVSLGLTLTYDDMLEATFRNLRLSLTDSQRAFFTSGSNHQLFTSAKNISNDPINGILPLTMIARSTLLLRLTIGYSSSFYKSAGITKGELHFFLDTFGFNNGFWKQTLTPNNFTELWDDVGESITEIDRWMGEHGPNTSLIEMNNELADELISYKQINRAAFWGLNV
jgi:hypothetical protein